ncbi:alpha/beta-hydrolase [Amylocystis lapponica]|nr:alpha/beta-hydrolase [Amylocystis lapponica]
MSRVAMQVHIPERTSPQLVPSTHIIWTPCMSGYECARLTVPLDYLSPAGVGPNATIALLRLPAADSENYKGALLVNPGGPGDSGTAFVAALGKSLSFIVGGGYDILGFDPRGVGATTPSAHCFDSESQSRVLQLQTGSRLINLSDASVPIARARESVVGQRCEKMLGGNGREENGGSLEDWGGGRFMGTASVAADMLRISEKMGQEKVHYLGFSYGTVIGQHFAAMYPDKVGRMVMDGIFDADLYRSHDWNSNIVDAEAVVDSFYTFCHKAGPELCPLHEPTVDAIKARVATITQRLTDAPIPLPFASHGPTVLQAEELHILKFISTYFPIEMFPALANILASIEQNDLPTLTGAFNRAFQCDCSQRPSLFAPNEAPSLITCGDAEPLSYTPDVFRAAFEELAALSPSAAPVLGSAYLTCAEARVRAKWRHEGPFAGNTSTPLLVLSAAYDPVCPLAHARAVHARFPGAALLVQASYGHCALLSAPSLCTARRVRAYFDDGTLPGSGTVCEVDELPFVGAVDRPAAVSAEDAELLGALRGLREGAAALAASRS